MNAQKLLLELQALANRGQFNTLVSKVLSNRMNNNFDSWYDEEVTGKLQDYIETSYGYQFSSKLNLKKSDFLIDVGCGTGTIMEKIIDSVNNVVGVDEDFNHIREAKRKSKLKRVKFLQSDASKIPIEDSVFNKTLCSFVFPLLNSVDHIETTFKELIRVTEHQGLVLISGLTCGSSKVRTLDFYERLLEKNFVEDAWFLEDHRGEKDELLFKVRKYDI